MKTDNLSMMLCQKITLCSQVHDSQNISIELDAQFSINYCYNGKVQSIFNIVIVFDILKSLYKNIISLSILLILFFQSQVKNVLTNYYNSCYISKGILCIVLNLNIIQG